MPGRIVKVDELISALQTHNATGKEKTVGAQFAAITENMENERIHDTVMSFVEPVPDRGEAMAALERASERNYMTIDERDCIRAALSAPAPAPEKQDSCPTVRSIFENECGYSQFAHEFERWLKENEYDGFFWECGNDTCGCGLGDLFPCGGNNVGDCRAAFHHADGLFYLEPEEKKP